MEHIDGALLVTLRTDPLGLMLDTPDGGRYFVQLSTTAAQALVVALQAQVPSEPTPELIALLSESAAEHQQNDEQFLKDLGVSAEAVDARN